MAVHEDQDASDLELVRRIKRGDEQGFREMVDRYNARVYSLAYGVLRNSEDAEEATQDAFLTLYRKVDTFDESKKFFSWFYRVALNAAYSRARRRKPAITVSLDDYQPRFRDDGHAASTELASFVEGAEDEAIARWRRSSRGCTARASTSGSASSRSRPSLLRRGRAGWRHDPRCLHLQAPHPGVPRRV